MTEARSTTPRALICVYHDCCERADVRTFTPPADLPPDTKREDLTSAPLCARHMALIAWAIEHSDVVQLRAMLRANHRVGDLWLDAPAVPEG